MATPPGHLLAVSLFALWLGLRLVLGRDADVAGLSALGTELVALVLDALADLRVDVLPVPDHTAPNLIGQIRSNARDGLNETVALGVVEDLTHERVWLRPIVVVLSKRVRLANHLAAYR